MPTLRNRILDFLANAANSGSTAREITNELLGREHLQQPVYNAARKLEQEGLLVRRERPDGKIGYYLTGDDAANVTPPPPRRPRNPALCHEFQEPDDKSSRLFPDDKSSRLFTANGLADHKIIRGKLTEKQKNKLRVAAEILKASAKCYEPDHEYLLPLWAAGVVTHSQPTNKFLIIGETAASRDPNAQTTRDHLYPVTQTAKLILITVKANPNISISEIEDILLSHSVYMRTTREENNYALRNAQGANWQERYRNARVKYTLC